MGPLIRDRVKDTSTTTGTGTLTLANSAPSGFRTFGSGVSDGDTVEYAIAHQTANEWEVGRGTYTASGTTLSRTEILASSNSGSAVSFSAGTKDVFVTIPAFNAGWLPSVTPPVDSGFAWVNQGGASVANVRAGVCITAPAASSAYQHRIRKKAAPSTPYTIDALVLNHPTGQNFAMVGLCFRQSSDGKLVTLAVMTGGSYYMAVYKWSDASTFSSTVYQSTGPQTFGAPGLWLRAKDDGTNRKFLCSGDGQNWAEVYSETRTTFMTADEVGWFVCPYSADAAGVLASWKAG